MYVIQQVYDLFCVNDSSWTYETMNTFTTLHIYNDRLKYCVMLFCFLHSIMNAEAFALKLEERFLWVITTIYHSL